MSSNCDVKSGLKQNPLAFREGIESLTSFIFVETPLTLHFYFTYNFYFLFYLITLEGRLGTTDDRLQLWPHEKTD